MPQRGIYANIELEVFKHVFFFFPHIKNGILLARHCLQEVKFWRYFLTMWYFVARVLP